MPTLLQCSRSWVEGLRHSDDADHPITGGDLVGSPRAMLKVCNHGLSEIAGYQLAHHVGVRVPRHKGIWWSEPVQIGDRISRRHPIGILIEHFDPFEHVTLEVAAKREREALARYLALCVFDRHEWPHCGLANGSITIVDLECVLPGIIPEHIDAPDVEPGYVDRCVESYLRTSEGDISGVMDAARDLNIEREVAAVLHRLTAAATADGLFAFDAHPYANVITPALGRAFRARLMIAQEYFVAPDTL